ncbi:MAG: metallophosphoesterase [Acidobacteria bacterium]|nr:metallophosphoesterase [Acidobacteriota bacterium]
MDSYFVVAGDLHLERSQYGLTVRFKDNQNCIETVLQDVCNTPECRGLILTGDTFHKRSLLPKYQMLLQSIYQRIKRCGKTLLAIDGNHDGSDSSWLDTIDVEINASGKVVTLDGKTAVFLSFQPREQAYQCLRRLQAAPDIIFLHGRLLELMTWAAHQTDPDYDFSANELRELGLKKCTVFMGEIHTYCDYHDPVADNWYVYSGSTEMTEISEGNVISDRFGSRYDAVKKYVRYYPGRPHGKNWECVELPNRPFLKRVISPTEDVELAIRSLEEWINRHPRGILALHYPDTMREVLKPHLPKWRDALLVFFEVPLSKGIAKPLQDMKESDILDIAQAELSQKQLAILRTVLTQEPFEPSLSELVRVSNP